MLDLSFNFRFLSRSACKLLPLVGILSSNIHHLHSADVPFQNREQELLNYYFNSTDEPADMEEVIDFLISLRSSLIVQGYQCPPLTQLALGMVDYLSTQGVAIDPKDFQEIYEEILRRESSQESCFFQKSRGNQRPQITLIKHKHAHKHHHKKKSREVKVHSKGAFGFLKCLAGSLICLIPVPAVQAIGAGLILNGINDIIDDAREVGDENARLQQMDQQRRNEEALGIVP